MQLEKTANMAVIAAAAVFVAANLYDRVVNRVPNGQRASPPALSGRMLSSPSTLPVGAKGSVALFISPDCHFCDDSIGFYRKLAESRPLSCDLKIFAIGPSPRETRERLEKYLSFRKLSVDGIAVSDFSSLGFLEPRPWRYGMVRGWCGAHGQGV